MLVLLLEHVPASAGADVVVVGGLIWGIRLVEGGPGAIGEDEREISEGLGEGSVEERVVFGIFGQRRWGQRRQLDRGIGRRRRRRRRYTVEWVRRRQEEKQKTHVVVFTDGWRTRKEDMVKKRSLNTP